MTPQQGRRVRTAVLISGRGSNMEALLDAAADEGFPADIVLVIANRSDAAGIERARARGVEAFSIEHRAFSDREAHEQAIDAALRERRIALVALAGYMRVLTPWLVSRWEGRMLNIHPSLLPLYPGLDTHARALAAGDHQHGCTVHLVTEGVDQGARLAQRSIEIGPEDDAVTLADRVLEVEHQIYPQTLARVAIQLLNGATRVSA